MERASLRPEAVVPSFVLSYLEKPALFITVSNRPASPDAAKNKRKPIAISIKGVFFIFASLGSYGDILLSFSKYHFFNHQSIFLTADKEF